MSGICTRFYFGRYLYNFPCYDFDDLNEEVDLKNRSLLNQHRNILTSRVSFLKTNRKLFTFILTLAVVGSAAGLWLNSQPSDVPINSTMILGAPVGYLTFGELLSATDATLQVTITSNPVKYLDFGEDGRPDYYGQPGVPVELVSAVVEDVLRGDQTLKGKSIFISQLSSFGSNNGEAAINRVDPGGRYVIIASENVGNPGVGTSPTAWVYVGSGQGIFDINSDGSLSVRRAGVWPEIFGENGTLRVMTLPTS